MKKLVMSCLATASVLAGATMFAATVSADGHVAKVKERQEIMKSMGKSFGPLVAVLKGESTDLAAAATAAQAMSDGMKKSFALFDAGTAAGEVDGSRAKAEVWSNAAEFKAASDALIAAAAKLAEVARSGDTEAFKASFGAVGQSCGGCHEGKGNLGGKFRTPKT